jgi:hypothetical protein
MFALSAYALVPDDQARCHPGVQGDCRQRRPPEFILRHDHGLAAAKSAVTEAELDLMKVELAFRLAQIKLLAAIGQQ